MIKPDIREPDLTQEIPDAPAGLAMPPVLAARIETESAPGARGRFQDRVAIVTGGVSGIGRCLTEAFRREGARVAVIDRHPANLPCDLFHAGDIADDAELVAFVHEVEARLGRVDCLVNNAMLSRKGILSGCTPEDFLYVQRVGVLAPYRLAQLCLPLFTAQAAIVNISSTRAFQSQADTESYTAAKGGITALTHALAVSLAGRVRVNSIAPGWIDTTDGEWTAADREQHPVKRIGTPADIAALALFLCSSESGFITGQNFTADGGMGRLMIYHGDAGWSYQP